MAKRILHLALQELGEVAAGRMSNRIRSAFGNSPSPGCCANGLRTFENGQFFNCHGRTDVKTDCVAFAFVFQFRFKKSSTGRRSVPLCGVTLAASFFIPRPEYVLNHTFPVGQHANVVVIISKPFIHPVDYARRCCGTRTRRFN